ncbi:MAG TPA: serine hydrolase domain-containing protein [Mobilitalea sp.]|nr:serine hydrolase domain-containing protein [Mobilitalea sp.]
MDKWKYMDQFLNKTIKTGPSGCGCAVAKDGKTLFENYYGFADIEKQKLITENSVYRQFSTTKLVVVTAAMILFERGGFLLNDPISEYFPEWSDTQVADKLEDGTYNIRPAKRPILVKDCFSMSMGIGYGGDDYTHQMMEKVRNELNAEVGDYTLRQDINAMSKVPIMFDPGTHWLYGFGHELVAGLIEVVSGKSIGEFLKEELFEPLGMKSTGYRFFDDMRENLVNLYQKSEDGSMIPVKGMFDERLEPEAKYEAGGAGLFSSVRDYLAFSQMLACEGNYKGNQIIGKKTIDLMRTNQLGEQQLKEFRNPYLDGYGYGLGVRTMMDTSKGSNTSIGEFGWTGMMGTYVVIDPSERISVVYMHNLQPNMEEYIHHRVRNIAFGAIR